MLLSDMLHAHFLQIVMAHKIQDQSANKIPWPVRLTNNDNVIKLPDALERHLKWCPLQLKTKR
jgi:anti-sigma factor ChrR (cupin superfamily)